MKRYLLIRKALIVFCATMSAIFFVYAQPPAYAESTIAIIDDFNDVDPLKNFLGLETSAGRFGSSDIVADFDIFGANPDSPLNTSHQMSWDGNQGPTTGPDDSFWYSFINNGSQTVLPVGQFTHLTLKIQSGSKELAKPCKRDVIGIDLQVNYPEGQIDGEGKPFRIYRAYQPVVNYRNLDLVYIGLYDFHDEYDPNIRFTDNLTYNLANLRAVAIATTDPTDNYMTDNDGDGFDLNLDNYGTLFIEDIGLWSKNASITKEIVIDDFEDERPTLNKLGLQTGGVDTQSDADEDFAGSRRHRMTWHVEHLDGKSTLTQYWRSDVSNNGTQLLDVSGYTHLAYDVIGQEVDMADLYEVILVVDRDGVETEFAYVKGAGSKRIHEEFIPLMEFRQNREGHYDHITPSDLARVKEIRLRFGKEYSYFMYQPQPIGNDYNGTIWIDNLRLVSLNFELYNYPPLISSIDVQDTTNDFIQNNPFERKKYTKYILVGQPVNFQVKAGDYNGEIASLSADLSSLDSATFVTELNGADAVGTFSWMPQLADVGTHTITFAVIDDKGAKDIQPFDVIVGTSTDPMWWGLGTVSGCVSDPVTDKPVAEATVTLKPYAYEYGLHDYTATTDANGNYTITDVIRYTQSSGGTIYWTSYTVSASKERHQGGPGNPAQITFSAAVSSITQNIPLQYVWWSRGTISGTVFGGYNITGDPTSGYKPLPGATVTLKPYAYGYGLHDITVTTDENGNYNATDVQRYTQSSGGTVYWAKYTVYISKDGYDNYTSGYLAFSETVFDIKQDATIGYIWWGGGTVSGTVFGGYNITGDPTSGYKPLPGATVTIKPHAYGYGTHDYTTTTDANGNYNFTGVIRYVQSSGGATTWISYKAYVSKEGYEDYVSEDQLEFTAMVHEAKHNVVLTAIPPVADFNCTTTGGPAPVVTFNNLSTGNITSYLWDFGDGTTSAEQNPTHTYNKVGHYLISLTATGPGGSNKRAGVGCAGIPAALRGRVTDATTGAALTGVTVNLKCPPNTLGYGGQDYTAITDASGFYFIEGIERYIANSPGNAPINYEIQISFTGYNDYSKQGINYYSVEDITNDIALIPIPPAADFTASPTTGDAPLTVTFTNQSTYATTYLWNFGDGQTSTEKDPSHTYINMGVYTVALTAKGLGGSNTASRDNYITVTGQASVGDDIILSDEIGGWDTLKNLKVSCNDTGNVTTLWQHHWAYSRGSGAYVEGNISQDSAATWQGVSTISSGSEREENVQISRDTKGNIFVAWCGPGLRLSFRHSSDNGATWKDIATVIESGMQYANGVDPLVPPILCNDSQGRVYIVWEKFYGNEIMLSRSLDYGVTWQAPVVVSYSDQLKSLRIACEDNGHVYILGRAQVSTDTYIAFKKSDDYGATWQEGLTYLNNPRGEPSLSNNAKLQRIACDNRGHVIVAWAQGYYTYTANRNYVYANISSDYGTTWKQAAIDTGLGMYKNSVGQLEIFYKDDTVYLMEYEAQYMIPHCLLKVGSSADNGATWSIPVSVAGYFGDTAEPYYQVLPRLCADKYENLYIMWGDKDLLDKTDIGRIMFSYSVDKGKTWKRMTLGQEDELTKREIACDSSGHVYIIGQDRDNYAVLRPITIDLPPVLNPIGNKEVDAGKYLYFFVSASDPNGDKVKLGVDNLPAGARLYPISEYAYQFYKRYYPNLTYPCAIFYWIPTTSQIGEHRVTFWAEDLDENGAAKSRTSEEVTITVKTPPNKPPYIYYLRNYSNIIIYWYGYDPEDRYNVQYSYKIDNGAWSAWSRTTYLYLPYITTNLTKGYHVFQVKAKDTKGLESTTRAIQFYVR